MKEKMAVVAMGGVFMWFMWQVHFSIVVSRRVQNENDATAVPRKRQDF